VKVGRNSVPGGWTGVEKNLVLQIWFLFYAECRPLSQTTSDSICDWLQKLWIHSLTSIVVLVRCGFGATTKWIIPTYSPALGVHRKQPVVAESLNFNSKTHTAKDYI